MHSSVPKKELHQNGNKINIGHQNLCRFYLKLRTFLPLQMLTYQGFQPKPESKILKIPQFLKNKETVKKKKLKTSSLTKKQRKSL